MRRTRAVLCAVRISVRTKHDRSLPFVCNGFERKHHSLNKFGTGSGMPRIRYERFFMDAFSNAMAAEFSYCGKTGTFQGSFYGVRYIPDVIADLGRGNTCFKRFRGRGHELARYITRTSHGNRKRRINDESFVGKPQIKSHDIAFLKRARRLVRNTVHHFVVYGNTERGRIWTRGGVGRVSEKGRRISFFADEAFCELIEFRGRNAGHDSFRDFGEHPPEALPSLNETRALLRKSCDHTPLERRERISR